MYFDETCTGQGRYVFLNTVPVALRRIISIPNNYNFSSNCYEHNSATPFFIIQQVYFIRKETYLPWNKERGRSFLFFLFSMSLIMTLPMFISLTWNSTQLSVAQAMSLFKEYTSQRLKNGRLSQVKHCAYLDIVFKFLNTTADILKYFLSSASSISSLQQWVTQWGLNSRQYNLWDKLS